uniref:Uncharacterized protein n=1 Tax=viral metagenome TaxID=1070528 RepID=A0A6C0CVL7_9ZZZZ
MGNQQSSNSKYGGGGEDTSTKDIKQIPLEETIDYIATHYILTSDFQSLRKLNEKTYCEKMIVLTSDIINKKFSDLEVDKILDRIENGSSPKDIEKENIVFFNKSQLHNAIEESNDKKEVKCNQIAKFYIKVAHLFASVVMTINPEYTHTDFFGNVRTYKLFEKDKIPSSGHFEVSKINLCGERVDILSNELVESEGQDNESKNVNVNTLPKKLCSMNLNKKGKIKTLDEEIGIPELMELYYDDGYDYKTGKFNRMSEETKKQFENDLKNFYTNFTGDSNVPENITKFSDIKLRDYSKEKICKASNNTEELPSSDDKKYIEFGRKDILYVKYAENLKKMIDSVNKKQQQLSSIIDKVFVYVYDSSESEKNKSEVIRINPDLTEDSLQDIVVECRNYIKDLYLTCEKDFTEGIKIYEAIVESKILNTTIKQIDKLEKISDDLVGNENVVINNEIVEKTV